MMRIIMICSVFEQFNRMMTLCVCLFFTIVTINESIAVITLTKKSSIYWNNLDSNPITKLLIPASEHGKL